MTEKNCGNCKELTYHLMWCERTKKHVTIDMISCKKFNEATIEDRLHCYYCYKKYKKIDEKGFAFKPDCDCLKTKILVTVIPIPNKRRK